MLDFLWYSKEHINNKYYHQSIKLFRMNITLFKMDFFFLDAEKNYYLCFRNKNKKCFSTYFLRICIIPLWLALVIGYLANTFSTLATNSLPLIRNNKDSLIQQSQRIHRKNFIKLLERESKTKTFFYLLNERKIFTIPSHYLF